MNNTKCSYCNATANIVRGTYDFKESGLPVPVLLMGIEILKCPNCNAEEPVIPNLSKLMRSLVLAVIRKPYRLNGEDVRFLRKYLRMTGEDFSRLIHTDKTNLSKWENNAVKIGENSDRLIRLVAFGLGDGLREELADLIRYFPQIKDEFKKVGIHIDAETFEYQYA